MPKDILFLLCFESYSKRARVCRYDIQSRSVKYGLRYPTDGCRFPFKCLAQGIKEPLEPRNHLSQSLSAYRTREISIKLEINDVISIRSDKFLNPLKPPLAF